MSSDLWKMYIYSSILKKIHLYRNQYYISDHPFYRTCKRTWYCTANCTEKLWLVKFIVNTTQPRKKSLLASDRIYNLFFQRFSVTGTNTKCLNLIKLVQNIYVYSRQVYSEQLFGTAELGSRLHQVGVKRLVFSTKTYKNRLN